MTAEILELDKDQLKFVLKNHECFSKNEVKIAAKLLAQGKYKRKLAGYNGCSCMYHSALERAAREYDYGLQAAGSRVLGGLFN